jgi:hypothetical protein
LRVRMATRSCCSLAAPFALKFANRRFQAMVGAGPSIAANPLGQSSVSTSACPRKPLSSDQRLSPNCRRSGCHLVHFGAPACRPSLSYSINLQRGAALCVLVQTSGFDFRSGYPGSSPGPGASFFNELGYGLAEKQQRSSPNCPDR